MWLAGPRSGSARAELPTKRGLAASGRVAPGPPRPGLAEVPDGEWGGDRLLWTQLSFNLSLVPEAPSFVGCTLRHLLLGDGLSGGQAGRELCGG